MLTQEILGETPLIYNLTRLNRKPTTNVYFYALSYFYYVYHSSFFLRLYPYPPPPRSAPHVLLPLRPLLRNLFLLRLLVLPIFTADSPEKCKQHNNLIHIFVTLISFKFFKHIKFNISKILQKQTFFFRCLLKIQYNAYRIYFLQ